MYPVCHLAMLWRWINSQLFPIRIHPVLVSRPDKTRYHPAQYRISHRLGNHLSMHGAFNWSCQQSYTPAKTPADNLVRHPTFTELPLEHQFLLFPKSSCRIYQHPFIGCIGIYLHRSCLEVIQTLCNMFHPLCSVAYAGNLLKPVYHDIQLRALQQNPATIPPKTKITVILSSKRITVTSLRRPDSNG